MGDKTIRQHALFHETTCFYFVCITEKKFSHFSVAHIWWCQSKLKIIRFKAYVCFFKLFSIWKPFKNIKNAFLFQLGISFRSQDFVSVFYLVGHCWSKWWKIFFQNPKFRGLMSWFNFTKKYRKNLLNILGRKNIQLLNLHIIQER